MRRKRNAVWLMVVSSLSLAALIYLVLNFPPTYNLSLITYDLPIVIVFFILIFTFLFSFFTFILKNSRRGFFIACFFTLLLVLRLLDLGNPLYTVLLLVIFGALELVFRNRK